MARGSNGADPTAPVQLRVLTELPPLPAVPIPEPEAGIPGEAMAAGQLTEEPAGGDLELAQAIVALTDAAVAWAAFGIDHAGDVAPPAAQAKVAAAMIRVAGHLGPAAGAARIVIPAPAIDAGALVIWSAVAWGGPLLLALQRWRDSRAEDRQADYGDGPAGGADRISRAGPNPGRHARHAPPNRPGGADGPAGPDFDPTDYGARLAAAVARPGGTVARRD